MTNYITTIETINQHPTYKQILADSFGGIMYDVANRGKYDTAEIVELWQSLSEAERDSVDGIMKGVFNFIKGMEA